MIDYLYHEKEMDYIKKITKEPRSIMGIAIVNFILHSHRAVELKNSF